MANKKIDIEILAKRVELLETQSVNSNLSSLKCLKSV